MTSMELALTAILDQPQKQRVEPRTRSTWPLPLLAALILHGAAFALILSASFAPRQAPNLAGESIPITLFAAVPGQAAVIPQATPPEPPQAAAAPKIPPPKSAPVPEQKVVSDPPKPVSIAPPPRHTAKKTPKISKANAPTQMQSAAAPAQATPVQAENSTAQSAPPAANTSGPGKASNAVIPARPRYRDNPPPAYPELARRRQMEGTVVLEALVNTRGRVDTLTVHASSGYSLLDNAALRAVQNWLFVPGKKGGMTMAMTVRVPVRFDLR